MPVLYRQPVLQELPTRHGTHADESGVSGDDMDENGEKEAWTTIAMEGL